MRRTTDPVTRADPLQRIAARPWAFDFFHALRWIECRFADRPRLGRARRPADEPLRLGQSPDQSFAPAALHALVPATATSRPRLEVRFFGLFGPNGPLPHHLTEHARQRLLHHGDATFARFADLFHHRLLLLFYRAWAQGRPTVGLDRPDEDRFAEYVASLIGLGSSQHRGRDAVSDHAKLHFAGHYASQVRHADGLASILTGYLGRPVRVTPFEGSWLEVPTTERTALATAGARRSSSSVLGGGALLGAMVWDRQHRFGLHVGPLDLPTFESLLPGGGALPALQALVDQYVGDELSWGLRLELRADEVKPCRPGLHGRLGWTSWLGMKDRVRHGELRLQPRAAKDIHRRPGRQTAEG